MIGVELTGDAAEVVRHCMARGLLIITSGSGNVLRFVPPLIITEADADHAVTILDEVLTQS
jgi:4-aminobutyrate aminotransferase-like enzyme